MKKEDTDSLRKRAQNKRPENGLRRTLRHAFLPVRGNGHHPHVLKREVIIGVLTVMLVFEVAVLAQGLILFKNASYMASVLPAVVASLTNDQRTENDLPPLAVSPLLTEAAQDKANDMAAKGYFSHISPDGTLPWYWFTLVGYNYQFAGENLAVNFTDSSDVVNAWMASPMHRANILKQDYTEVGIGMATGMYEGHSTIFVVQFFGKPETSGTAATADVAAAPTPATGANASANANVLTTAVKDVKVALNEVPAPTELMTTSAADSPLQTTNPVITTASANATDTPAVLGIETAAGAGGSASAVTANAPNFFEKVLASPFSTSNYIFAGMAAFVLSILITGVRYRKRLPRMAATIGGLSVVVVVLGIAIMNEHYISGTVKVDQVSVPTQPAAAIEANTAYR